MSLNRREPRVSGAGARRVYGGVTGEERTAERRRKLIEAGMNLFGSASSGSVRVKDVVAEAGLTERYFYESFADLNALFGAVLGTAADEIESRVDAAMVDARWTRSRGCRSPCVRRSKCWPGIGG